MSRKRNVATWPGALVGECQAQRAPMLALLEELVNINSFTRNRDGGAAVAAVLARELGAIPGLEVRLRESAEFAPHVVAATASAADSAADCVALVGHLDTVFPPGSFEGFSCDGDIARGPGVLDMKGGLTTAIFALRMLAATQSIGHVAVRLVIVSDEEIGSPEGAGVLADELRGAAAALVFEAGRAGDAIITARKGTGGVRAEARGPGALRALARFVDAAQALTAYDRGVTVNVGTIEGSGEVARALVDLRFVTTADGHAVEAELREAARAASDAEGVVELGGGIARAPLERSDASVALCHEYGACARSAGLGSDEAGLIGGGSDASTTAALGIPSIDGLGPRGTGFHTKDELIEVATLVPRLEALVRFLWGRTA